MAIPGGSPNPYLQPQQPHPYAGGYSSYPPPPPPAPPAGGGRGGGVPGWLWGLGGALLASAAWGGVLLATGGLGGGDRPDLAGYGTTDDLCAAADVSAFEDSYSIDSEPRAGTFSGDRLEKAVCDITLTPTGDESYNSVYLNYEVSWHRGTDPAPEFADQARSSEVFFGNELELTVEEVSGLGDEAYLVTFAEESGELSWAVLSVREGWFEAHLSWNAFLDTPEYAELVEARSVTAALRTSAEKTLVALKE
ncbi:hypothetical protein N0X72_08795 [Streptomyces carpaticus]|uniref:hypothetical protein n=1 Tax=Streptomyces carpaticus TaxID=285558 RepID=UPI00220D3943|nr:hypothetical protein N0X72_08795 [Streptomyces carpaticus]